MKKYRIKRTLKWVHTQRRYLLCPSYNVQFRSVFRIWVTVKSFSDADDPDFAQREAEELLDKLNEK